MTWERFDDEPAGALRDEAPDVLAPIDELAPVSGHVPTPEGSRAASSAAEHDWAAASDHIFPALRPGGIPGLRLADLDAGQLAREGMKKHALALVDPGPADLSIVYV